MLTGTRQAAPPPPVVKSPRELAFDRLANARNKLQANERVLRELVDDQEKRAQRLVAAEETLRAGSDAIRDMVSERVIHVGLKFQSWLASKGALAKKRDEVKALKLLLSRGKVEGKRLEAAVTFIQAEIALAERGVAQYGKLLTLPVRPRRRRAHRNAD